MAAIFGDSEALVAEIRRRAQHRAVDIEEEARKRSAAILAEAQQQSESVRRQFEQQRESELATLMRRSAARGELEARRRFAILREAPINRVWQEAQAHLRALITQSSYRDTLKRLAVRAARELGGSQFTLAADPVGHNLLSPETLEQWSKEVGVRFRRAEEPAAAWGGLLATSGRNRLDATFPTRLATAQLSLREQVFRVLSEEGR